MPSTPSLPNKHELYELSVQSPDTHAAWFDQIYSNTFKKKALHLREDFCGTFQLSCEWVKLRTKNTALGLDLDPEPISYGMNHHFSKMTSHQKKRLKVAQQDVLSPTRSKSDLIVGCNFSFCIFKKRDQLLKYFKSAHASLNSKGMLLLEIAGGPGMIAPMREKKEVKRSRKEKFTYIWHQKSFDPITNNAHYSIHFKLGNGKTLKDQFTYDWRLWSIPELRETLQDAGFKETMIYWETEHEGEGTDEYVPTEKGDNSYAWVAYVLGIKR
jgi:hypothetical protein